MTGRKINKRILILCEGVTEYLYAKGIQMELPRALQRSVTIDIDHSNHSDPLRLTQEAIKRAKRAWKERNGYDAIWLFFDHDNSPHLQEAFVLIKKERYHIAYTAICFEHWLILHYENCGRPFQNGDEALKHLRKFWPTYHKTKSKPFEQLRDRLDLAVKRAEILIRNQEVGCGYHEQNPHFTIPELIEYFNGLREEYGIFKNGK